MDNVINGFDLDAVKKAKHGAVMSKAVRDLANQDCEVYQSAMAIRATLVSAWIAEGRTVADWLKPEEGKCDKFYRELKAISFAACGSKSSSKGLTEAEKKTLKDGGYHIATVIDKDIKPSQLPDWATEPNRISGLSIRRYWQQQSDGWLTSTKRSMEKAEKQAALVSGGAQALTKSKAELEVRDLHKCITRHDNAGEEVCLLTGTQVNQLWAIIEDIGQRCDIEVPARPEA